MSASRSALPPDLGMSEAPALPAIGLETVILIPIELLVANPDEGLAYLGEVRPTLAHDGLTLLKLDFLFGGPEVQRADGAVDD
jgi:hypothetical protein